MNLLVRLVIITIACGATWLFSGNFSLNFEILTTLDASWFNILFAFLESVVAPAWAITAIVLAVVNKHLLGAAVAAGLAILFYSIGYLSFLIAIMIYGF